MNNNFFKLNIIIKILTFSLIILFNSYGKDNKPIVLVFRYDDFSYNI